MMKAKVSVTLAMLMFIVAPAIRGQQALVNDGRSKISVNGEAMVYARPDKIIFALGIETWNREIMAAKDENNQILKKTIAVIKELGVREKEIQTDQLFIEPRYKDNYRGLSRDREWPNRVDENTIRYGTYMADTRI
jgi:uncharacterized protein YggE